MCYSLIQVQAQDAETIEVPVTEAGWSEDSNGRRYYYEDGTYPCEQWLEIDDERYYFNAEGYAVTGWLSYEDEWFYMDSSGIMQTGWYQVKNTWYYSDENGVMQTGWINDNGTWYYCSSSGARWTGWLDLNGKWYYLNENGTMQTGWHKVRNTWYYFNENGVMQTGWVKSYDKWYYCSSSGAMQTGWLKLNGKWYYLNENGTMQTGWYKAGNTWYYSDENGRLQTGWIYDEGDWYYSDENGEMQTGWIRVNWYWYYMSGSGKMLTGYQTINGVKYHLNETSGHWDEPEGDPKFYKPDSILILANKKHKLPDGYVPDDLAIPDVLRIGSNIYMQYDAAVALEEMFEGAADAGITLVMGSGYRSESTQRAIYNNYVARDGQAAADRYSARPGHSEHQTGLAVDISDATGANYLYQSFENTKEGKWLFANAYKYGFILRYPSGKEDITGYMYEPWHYRYVGITEAGRIYRSGLTFEEYYGVEGGDYD